MTTTPAVAVTIAGASVTPFAQTGNPKVKDAIGQRSTCSLVIEDVAGTGRYKQGSAVNVVDNTNTLIFGGVVMTDTLKKPAFGNVLLHTVECADWHYLADKRVIATSYSNQTCGFMVQDIVTNWLAAEGIRTVPNLLTANESDVETDTTGFTATNSATITRDTTQAWHGVASLKTVTSASVAFSGWGIVFSTSGLNASQPYTLSAYVNAPLGAALTVTIQDNVSPFTVYGSGTLTGTGTWQRVSVSATLPGSLPASLLLGINTGATPTLMTFSTDGIQFEPGAYASPWLLGGASTIQTGPTLQGSIAFNYKTASAALDKIATLAGFIWWIDAYKRLNFVAQSTNTAPWTFDGTQADDEQPVELELTNPLYRNSEWILGAKEVTATQTETRKGDNATRAFTMSYPLHAVPTITLNSVSQTVGIKGVDTGKQWYWSKGDAVIQQDSGGTILIATDTLQVVYKGEYNVIANSQDTGQVSTQQTLEGAGSGIVEDVQTDTSLTTSAQAFQLASSLLAKYATSGEMLRFTTKTSGLQAGQLLTVNLPAPWNLSGTFLIESVDVWFDGLATWYWDVSALSGPVNDTWVQFFTRIATVGSITDDQSAGTQQVVSLLVQFTQAWNWTQALTMTTYACALFPITFPKALC